MFSGLPADVVGARYLYDLVEQAFETETALFRAGPTYAATPTDARSRSAGRRVLQDVYEQGHEAGLGFKCTPGIGHER